MQTIQNGSTLANTARTVVGFIAFLLLPSLCSAQTRPMPPINAKTLNGEIVNLPNNASGKPVVLVFGFARSAKDSGETWGKQLIEMQQERNNFNFFQVATLSGAPRFTYGLITHAIRASVPSAYYSHMLLLTANDKAWRDLLNATDDGSAYVVLCSATGEIQWQTRVTGQAQFDALRAQLQKDAD